MRVRPPHPAPALALASVLLLLAACDGTRAESPAATVGGPVTFDETRAFADLRHLCEVIGPRRIATPGAEKTRAYLRAQLEPHGWTIEESKFEATAPEGAQRQGTFTGVNVLARRAGTLPGEIWLANHYDTYDKPGFVGANDAGSSTALLIELGRQLGGEGPRTGMSLVLAFLDGEEKFPPLAWHDDTNSTFGSRHEAGRIKAAKREKEIRAFLLFDMIGDADLGLYFESSTDSKARGIFEKTAHALGDKQLFVGSREIKDDHIHFRKLGIPVSNLIDFNYGPNNSYWHELADNLEHVSAASLGRVGRLVLTALPELEKTYGAERR
jgi:hypothetical protein